MSPPRAARLPLLVALLAWPCAVARAQEEAAEAEAPAAVEDEPEEPGAESPATRVSCLDDVSPDGQPRKGVQKRPFLKDKRFELTALGGLYASDVLSSSYTFGGALTFYPSEDFGLEAMLTYAPVDLRIEEAYTGFDQENRFKAGSAFQAMAGFVYAPFHAKFKFTEETIVAGDLVLVAGAGRTLHDSAQGLTWQAGVGMRLYVWKYVTFRIDLRDFVVPQEVLGRTRVANNITLLGGLSVWVL